MSDTSDGAAAKSHVLIVNARYDTLDVEREILAAHEVVAVSASTSAELAEHVRSHRPDAVMVGSRPVVGRDVIAELDSCRVIVRYGIGVDNIDIPSAFERGIVVANVRDYCTDEVATHAFALVLACARGLPRAIELARGGVWGTEGLGPVRSLADVRVGIIGFGAIGRRLAELLGAIAVPVCAVDPWVDGAEFKRRGVDAVGFDQLLETSDIISINSPLTDATTGLVDVEAFARLKAGAFLVNTARAEIVDEEALLDALTSGRLAGAALDVLRDEPPSVDDRLVCHPNVIVTPHVAWYSERSVERLRRGAAEQVRDVLAGGQARFAITGIK